MGTWPAANALTLVEGDRFAEQADALDPSRKTLDRVLEGVSWAIARDPEYFPRVAGTTLRVAQVIETTSLPALLVLYRSLDRDRCELVAVLEDPEG